MIEGFPSPYGEKVLDIWESWISTNPNQPYHENWTTYSSERDDKEALYTELRVYLKRVANELRDFEIPPTTWQKLAKALASIASVFLVVLLALSRVARASD